MIALCETMLQAGRRLLLVRDDPARGAAALSESSRRKLQLSVSECTWEEYLGSPGVTQNGDLLLVMDSALPPDSADWDKLRERLAAQAPEACCMLLPIASTASHLRAVEVLGDCEYEIRALESDKSMLGISALPLGELAPTALRRHLASARNVVFLERNVSARETAARDSALAYAQASAQMLRRQNRTLEANLRRITGSRRWRYASFLVDELRSPLRTGRKIAQSIRARFTGREVPGGLFTRMVYALSLPRTPTPPQPAGWGALVSTELPPSRLELMKYLRTGGALESLPLPGGVFLIQAQGAGAPQVHALTPNDWAYRLNQAHGAVALISPRPEFDRTAWRGALAGIGYSEADPLLKLMHTCRRRGVPVLLHLPPPALRLPFSPSLVYLADFLAGRPQDFELDWAEAASLPRIALEREYVDPVTVMRYAMGNSQAKASMATGSN